MGYSFDYSKYTRGVDKRSLKRKGPERAFEIKRLWERQHEIIGLALQGFKHKDIAQMLGVTNATVSSALNSRIGKMKLQEMRAARDEQYIDVSKQIAALTAKALKTYHELFDNPDIEPELKKKTADTVALDLAGLRAPTRIDQRTIHAHVTAEELEEFRRRGIEAAREAGLLIDSSQIKTPQEEHES